MSGRLSGRVALVSGGAGGCGRAASELFAQEGAKVAIVDLPGSAGAALAQEINAAGGQAMFAAADVSDSAAATAAVAEVEAAFGAVTALFNHAGTLVVKPFLDTTEEEWDRLMGINVRSMFLMTKAVLPGMIAAGGGAIV
ncbi:MAG: oxidoreductase, partial [Azorhizobium sp. 12-66-6]